MKIDNLLYEERAQSLEGMSIMALWGVSCPNDQIWNDEFPFEEKRNYFFSFLREFMERGKIKLANHGEFLDGTIDEQINLFINAFPENEEGLVHGLWFTFDECPGGIVWVHENGYLDWT